ncbi:DUF2637 domain-containing protein [Streptomyces longispororuber]|uniref:DUF2637 domain-containing protein n=1 Tax=Streptomyces longispororuber TaxID=68230 RepID=UPI003F555CC5
MAAMQLTRMHRILIGVVVFGALVIAGIGFAGSYAAVRDLAEKKGFGDFSYFFPIGIDAGICVLLALDLLLTWIRIPFPLLRQTAWLLTAATIAFNGAAAWPDPLGVGMHAVIPVLFVVAVEAARHAVGRIADITADKHMEGVRMTRWLLSPLPTFLLWRRMKLWELRSYDQVIKLEQERLVYQARLRSRFGRRWRSKAPVESLMPLRLARYGVPLAETAPAGLAAAGIEPAVLPPAPAPAQPELAPAPVPSAPQSLAKAAPEQPQQHPVPGEPDAFAPRQPLPSPRAHQRPQQSQASQQAPGNQARRQAQQSAQPQQSTRPQQPGQPQQPSVPHRSRRPQGVEGPEGPQGQWAPGEHGSPWFAAPQQPRAQGEAPISYDPEAPYDEWYEEQAAHAEQQYREQQAYEAREALDGYAADEVYEYEEEAGEAEAYDVRPYATRAAGATGATGTADIPESTDATDATDTSAAGGTAEAAAAPDARGVRVSSGPGRTRPLANGRLVPGPREEGARGPRPSAEAAEQPAPEEVLPGPGADGSGLPDDMTREEAYFTAFRKYVSEMGDYPNARQFSLYLLDLYGVTGQSGGPLTESTLRPYLRDFRDRYQQDLDAEEHIA